MPDDVENDYATCVQSNENTGQNIKTAVFDDRHKNALDAVGSQTTDEMT